MSGAEFITIIGIISNVVSVINFCSNVIDDTIAIRKNTRDVPQAYQSLQVILPLVELTLNKTQQRIDAGEIDKKTAESLKPAIQGCQTKVNELANVFRRMRPQENTGRLKLLFKSATNLTHADKVNALAEEIMRYHLLIYQAGAPPLSSQEIEKAVDRVGVKLDSQVANLVSQLKAKQSVPSSLSLGSATASTQNFQTSSSNVTFSGTTQINNYYHVYNGQIVDVMKTEFGSVPRVVEGAAQPTKLIDEDGSSGFPLNKQPSKPPAVSALQFDTPHMSGISKNSYVPPIELDDKSEPSTATSHSFSSRFPAPHDPHEALTSALTEIREAAAGTTEYPGIARQRYSNALRTLSLVTEKSLYDYPSSQANTLLFRRARLRTLAEIGLSQVELPATPHLKRGAGYNAEAFSLAEAGGEMESGGVVGMRARANVDKGHLKQREARVDEKSGLTSKAKVRSVRGEAFECYAAALEGMRGRCEVMDDFEVLAQAALGAGRMVRKMGGNRWSGGGGGWHSGGNRGGGMRAEEYFEEALRAVGEGGRVGERHGEAEEEREALRFVGGSVRAVMGVAGAVEME